MVDDVIKYLNPQPGHIYIDATCGTGNHSYFILRKTSGRCTLICIDKDPRAIMRARSYLKEFSENVIFVRDGFENILEIVKNLKIDIPSGILFDLGFSYEQISNGSAGFGFRQDGPLDMRFDPETGISARDVVNNFSVDKLAELLKKYGELKNSLRIARLICEERKRRKFETTRHLSDFIATCGISGKGIHPATRVFQAIRIYVNNELENLSAGLNSAAKILMQGGRIVVISYHSLEDRIVKNFMRKTHNLKILTKKPIVPDEYEKKTNPSSRSAKMRAAEVIS